MRIRHKKWAAPELALCPYFIREGESFCGGWHGAFARVENPLHLELGCGKGSFVAALGPDNPGINFLAVDIKDDILAVARRNISAAYEERGLAVDNILLAPFDIERIERLLSPEDRVERVYINFCNPWPNRTQKKHRLTYPRVLEKYKRFMTAGALLIFKTDDDGLFDDTLEYLDETGFEVIYQTRDLHRDGPPEGIPSPQTEHELFFSSRGVPIKLLAARERPQKDAATDIATD